MAPRGFKSISLDIETLKKIREITGENSYAGAVKTLLRIYHEFSDLVDLKYEWGYRDGYEKGFRDGYEKARREFEKEKMEHEEPEEPENAEDFQDLVKRERIEHEKRMAELKRFLGI
ncbi:MAG: hypothetical protein ACTSYM_03940 [Candidatus Baldrarchaeia archaeon]